MMNISKALKHVSGKITIQWSMYIAGRRYSIETTEFIYISKNCFYTWYLNIGGTMAQWLRCWTLNLELQGSSPSQSAHCVVFLGKTLYSDFLTPPRCKWVPDPVKDCGRQRQRGRGDGRRPHYAGPVKSGMLHISLTYDHLVMVIPYLFTWIWNKKEHTTDQV